MSSKKYVILNYSYVTCLTLTPRMAVILCNLKPSKMRGILSEAMVMCASTPEKVKTI